MPYVSDLEFPLGVLLEDTENSRLFPPSDIEFLDNIRDSFEVYGNLLWVSNSKAHRLKEIWRKVK